MLFSLSLGYMLDAGLAGQCFGLHVMQTSACSETPLPLSIFVRIWLNPLLPWCRCPLWMDDPFIEHIFHSFDGHWAHSG